MGKGKEKSGSKKFTYAYPSPYGSHTSMVDQEKTTELKQEGRVVCKDEYGTYVTDTFWLDNGMADPNRYDGKRIISEDKE